MHAPGLAVSCAELSLSAFASWTPSACAANSPDETPSDESENRASRPASAPTPMTSWTKVFFVFRVWAPRVFFDALVSP